jgi:hypothetical protein
MEWVQKNRTILLVLLALVVVYWVFIRKGKNGSSFNRYQRSAPRNGESNYADAIEDDAEYLMLQKTSLGF